MKNIIVPLYYKYNKFNKKNTSEIKVIGNNIISEKVIIEFDMSKEALLGFGIYAIRLSRKSEKDKKNHIHTDPLNSPYGNQPLGFFLTSISPSVILMYNQSPAEKVNINKELKIIKEKNDLKFYYNVQLENNDKCCEDFEIGFQNIVNVRIIDENHMDITHKCLNVIFYINQKELFEFGKNLIILSHNYKENEFYEILRNDSSLGQYDFGICLSKKSSKLIIKCSDCGNVFDYEPNFGIVE